eukprot:SAG22_NODE_2108_length_2993_cov_7.220654_2_plen_144_part_00
MDPGTIVPLQVSATGLAKVVEYLEKSSELKLSGSADADMAAWADEWKEPFDQRAQLPLLFQTMTAANYLNVAPLVDELCAFVAEVIAQRTPNEILDYFNVKNDATWEEEQELIATHKWIDPEGLIAKDREKRLAEKNQPGANL